MNELNQYAKFLALKDKVDHSKFQLNVDLTAIKLLEAIAIYDAKNSTLTVGETMQLKTLGSAATIHRKIDELFNNELIELKFLGTNRRKKYLVPSKKTIAYFAMLSELMFKVAN